MKEVLSLILGGGRGTRLYPLTKLRSKPAVPVAGKYRLIDIPVSNCINSGFSRVYVLTQFLSVSLHRHIANTYKFDPFSRSFVEVLAAQQTNESADWYQGTADAVRQQIRYVQEDGCTDVLILSGDQLYRMDFAQMLKTHRESKADATIAVLPVVKAQTPELGLARLDGSGRVVGFVEKPKQDSQLVGLELSAEWLRQRGVLDSTRNYLANMGIYLFKRQVLLDLLNVQPLATDFGKEVFPRGVRTQRIMAHVFDGYWEDLGTIKAYHEANLALCSDNPPFDFHSPEGIIYTRMRFLPASRVGEATLKECLISDGCVIQAGARLERCLIGVRSLIGHDVTIKNSIVIGADRYETEVERAGNRNRAIPAVAIGERTVIEQAIIDKDCRIGKNVRIGNQRGVQDAEGPNYVIREGIVVIPRGTTIPDGTII
jgi:glucose-1-phosphate adenylyltransferase